MLDQLLISCGEDVASPARGALAVSPLLQALQSAADQPLARSHALPAACYTDPAFYQWEVERVLRPGWQCLAHTSQIPNPGDFLTADLLGEPLIVVHGKDGAIRVLSRVCPHRAMDIMPPNFGASGHGPAEPRAELPRCGQTRLFLCPYHHWSFELDGSLKGCPEMHRAEEFYRDDHGLHTFRSETWNGLVFVNLDGHAPALFEQWADLHADLAGWDMSTMQVVTALEWDCPFNWKVLVENFMEPYHHLGAHATTLQPMMPARGCWTEAERPHSQRVNLPLKPEVAAALAASFDKGSHDGFPAIASLAPEDTRRWTVFLGYPHLLLFGGPDRMIWYRVLPEGAERMKLLTTVMVRPEAQVAPDFDARRDAQKKMLIDFHLEDMEVCAAVQRGFHASTYRPGRLSHLEMPIWLLQRYLAARARGTWPCHDRPAAPSNRI